MQPLEAIVRQGRLTLDVPTERPDGEVVFLLALDELLSSTDAPADEGVVTVTLGPKPRRRNVVDAAALIAELRSI